MELDKEHKHIMRLVRKINKASKMIDDVMEEFIMNFTIEDQSKLDDMIQHNVNVSDLLLRIKETMRLKAIQLND